MLHHCSPRRGGLRSPWPRLGDADVNGKPGLGPQGDARFLANGGNECIWEGDSFQRRVRARAISDGGMAGSGRRGETRFSANGGNECIWEGDSFQRRVRARAISDGEMAGSGRWGKARFLVNGGNECIWEGDSFQRRVRARAISDGGMFRNGGIGASRGNSIFCKWWKRVYLGEGLVSVKGAGESDPRWRNGGIGASRETRSPVNSGNECIWEQDSFP